MKEHFDVIVAGGGLVGTSAAIALNQQGLQVMLCNPASVGQPEFKPGERLWDSRIYAISPGNARWLRQLNVWDSVDPCRVCPIEEMKVYGDDGSLLTFSAVEANAAELGYVLENSALIRAMQYSLANTGVRIVKEAPTDFLLTETFAELVMESGGLYSTPLIVAADGSNSRMRKQAGIAVDTHAYLDMGLVANFETELPHHGTAYQWFSGQDVMAWLPLPGNRISIVWSTREASSLMNIEAGALTERVAEAGRHVLGQLRLLTPACVFPLCRKTADSLVQPHLALVGDAAHQVHPLAGQGVNLGFRDVMKLSDILATRHRLQSLGDWNLLRRYERARKSDIVAIAGLTHGLHELFEAQQPFVRQLRNMGLRMVEQSRFKQRLVQQALT